MTTVDWTTFFVDAGVVVSVAKNYAAIFVQKGIRRDSVDNLNWDDLQEMGITELGDIKCILGHAKKVDKDISPNLNKGVHIKDHICDECGKVFSQNSHLQSHRKTIHLQDKTNICKDCGSSFSTMRALILHNNRTHLKNKDKRGKTQNNDVEIIRALATKSNEDIGTERAEFEVSGEIIPLIVGVEGAHMEKADVEETIEEEGHCQMKLKDQNNIKCEECLQVFSSFSNLDNHVREAHKNIRKHVCELCSLGFYYESELIIHKIIHWRDMHETVKQFRCEQCPYESSLNESLQDHIKSRHSYRDGATNSQHKLSAKIEQFIEADIKGEARVETGDHDGIIFPRVEDDLGTPEKKSEGDNALDISNKNDADPKSKVNSEYEYSLDDEYILESERSSILRKRGRPRGTTKNKKANPSDRRTRIKQRRIDSSALADGQRLYAATPFDDPRKERCRRNAINAKLNRERRAKEKEELTKEMDSLKQENKRMSEEADVSKHRVEEAEKRAEQANIAKSRAEEAKGKEALYILTMLEENKRLREEADAADRRREEAETELERLEEWAMDAEAEMERMQAELRENGLEFKRRVITLAETCEDQIASETNQRGKTCLIKSP